MRYRLTAKGKFVFTVLPLLLIFSVCAVIFGVNTFLGSSDTDPTETPPLVMEASTAPPPDTPTDEPGDTDEPFTEAPDTETPPPETTEPPEEPTEPPEGTPIPLPTEPPAATARPPERTTAPVTGENIYDSRWMVTFLKDSDTVDKTWLIDQLKSMITTSSTSFQPPSLESHYLVIEGFTVEDEEPGIALKRARFVRETLKEIGLPDSKLLDLSSEANASAGAMSSVKLSFLPISGASGGK
jgi:hypothetical protein